MQPMPFRSAQRKPDSDEAHKDASSDKSAPEFEQSNMDVDKSAVDKQTQEKDQFLSKVEPQDKIMMQTGKPEKENDPMPERIP